MTTSVLPRDYAARSRFYPHVLAGNPLFVMDTEAQPTPWGLEPVIDVGELATYLGIPVSTIYDWRTHGLGPPAYRFGKHLKFAISDVRLWVEQQRDGASASPFGGR